MLKLTLGLLGLAAAGLFASTHHVEAKELKMLALAWLSQNGVLMDAEQYYASFFILPMAVKHFNERSDAIIPYLSSRTANCSATINMLDGIKDGRGLANVDMSHLIGTLSRDGRIDVIHGPTKSDVRPLASA
jgi:hypothetical protein